MTKENILELLLQLQHDFAFFPCKGYLNPLLTVAVYQQWGCDYGNQEQSALKQASDCLLVTGAVAQWAPLP